MPLKKFDSPCKGLKGPRKQKREGEKKAAAHTRRAPTRRHARSSIAVDATGRALISPYLPISPHISPYLPMLQAEQIAADINEAGAEGGGEEHAVGNWRHLLDTPQTLPRHFPEEHAVGNW